MPAHRLGWITVPDVGSQLSAARARLSSEHARRYGRDGGVPEDPDRRVEAAGAGAAVPFGSLTLADLLPRPILVLGAWALVVIVVAMAASILQDALGAVSTVVIPMTIAVLLAALLQPLYLLMRRIRLHRIIAALLAVILPTAAVVTGLTLAGSEIATGASELAANAQAGVDSVLEWLRTGPLHISGGQINEYLAQATEVIRRDAASWSTGALNAGVAVIDIVAGLLICLVSAFFFLLDGGRIWQFTVRFVPGGVRDRVHEAGRRGWVSLGAYARAQIVVAAVNAFGIALGAWFLDLPLVLPIFVLVFISAFVPIIGTAFAGIVPTLIAFVAHGPTTALIMLGIVLLVQQIEGHVLQPFLMGRAVDIHPLGVIIAVACATYLYGIPGALFAVPALAFVNSTALYLTGHDPFPELGREPLPPRPDDPPDALADEAGTAPDSDAPATTGAPTAPDGAASTTGTRATAPPATQGRALEAAAHQEPATGGPAAGAADDRPVAADSPVGRMPTSE